MKIKATVMVLGFVFGLLFVTRNVNAYDAPVIRAKNVSQTQVNRVSFEGKVPCHDEIQIVDKELPHGEQINAYPKTVCQ